MKPTPRDQLITSGVRSLHEFGYPNCTAATILTDEIYKQFFKSLLVEAKESTDVASAVSVINGLIAEVSK